MKNLYFWFYLLFFFFFEEMFSRNRGAVEKDVVENEKKILKGKHIRLDEDDDEVGQLSDDDDNNESENDDDDGDECSSDDEEDELQSGLKQELNKMSFEDVQKLQNKLGLKK
jgi:hypothetical protein